MDYKDQWTNFLDPETLKFNLTFISVYIAVYENFKETMISNVKGFYWCGFIDGKEVYEGYDRDVLGLVKTEKSSKTIKATIEWLKNSGALDENDKTNFKRITNLRDTFAHQMTTKLFEGLPDNAFELFEEMIKMFKKFDIWWIAEIEIPISGDYSVEQQDNIKWDEVTSMNRYFLEIMCEIAFSGSDKYIKAWESLKAE
jgi:hypothetical protein